MSAGILSLALALDAVLGEPKWLWSRITHPAVLMGQLVAWCDTRYNKGADPRPGGIMTVAILLATAIVLGLALSLLGDLVELIVVAVLLAQRSLVDHVQAVADALRLSTGDGRIMVARIVSRDTRDMDQSDVSRAAIESAAENLSDGVIAPAFWFLIGGLPGILAYKFINTADSMIGYRTEKYEEFGWAAARLDDGMNWIPARLTAVARVLNVALSGPRSYAGERTEMPFVHEDGAHDIGPEEIDGAINVLWRSWGLALACCVVIAIF